MDAPQSTSRLLRLATLDDAAAIAVLIDASVRGLGRGYYSDAQIDASLRHMFGVDSQLIRDRTYHVVEDGGEIVAAGGWSARRTLFGGDRYKSDVDDQLDPATEPARIRAFYVHPAHARQGLGRMLFRCCARAAYAAGFRRLELVATLPGEPLYRTLGFTVVEPVVVPLSGEILMDCLRMSRDLVAADGAA